MKKKQINLIFILFISIYLSACSYEKMQKENFKELIKVTPADLQRIVSTLSADELMGRKSGTEGIEKAASFLESELRSYATSDEIKISRDTFSSADFETSNIISYIPGTDAKLKEEVILIGAHYDHIGKTETTNNSQDSIANGANDNASGVSAALAIAKHFSQTRNNKRSILVVLFSAEEFGLLGSKEFAKSLIAQNTKFYCMINFEMIGVPMKNRDFQAYLTGYETTNMAAIVNSYSNSNLLGFLPKAQEYNLFKRSDNFPIFNEFTIPSQTISTFDFTNYAYYHDVDDEAEHLNYKHMADLINNLIPAIEKISQSPNQEIKLSLGK